MGESVQQHGSKLPNQEFELRCLPLDPTNTHIHPQHYTGERMVEEQAREGKGIDVCLHQVKIGQERRAGRTVISCMQI